MEIKRMTAPLEIKASSPQGELEGIGNTCFRLDFNGDIMAPYCFKDSLDSFISDGFIGGLNHNYDAPIGSPTEASESLEGLLFKAKLSAVQYAQDARTLMMEGIVKKLSIGFRAQTYEYMDTDAVMAFWANGGYTPSQADIVNLAKTIGYWGDVRVVHKAQLVEVSPVLLPANDQSNIVAVKSDMRERVLPTEKDFERHLRDSGFSRKDAQTIISKGFRPLLSDSVSEEEPPTALPVVYVSEEEARAVYTKTQAQFNRIAQYNLGR